MVENQGLAAFYDQNAISALAQSSLVSMILLDEEGMIRFLNEPAKFAFPDLKYGQSLFSFVHDAHHGRLDACLNNRLDFSPKLVQLHFKMVNHAMLWEVFRRNSTSEVVLLTQETGFADIHREQLVRQQQEIFQALEDGFFEIDDSGFITSVNQTLINWLQGSYADQPKLEDWFKKDDKNLDFYQKLQAIKQPFLSDSGVCFCYPSSRWCRFELVSRLGFVMVRLTDISDEITKDDELKLAQRRMLAILESTGDANLLIDNSGKLLSFNGKAIEVIQSWLGIIPFEGLDFQSCLSRQQTLDFEALIRKALEGEFVNFELKINSLLGLENWYSVRIFPAKEEGGEIFGASLNLSDLTKHKELEQILTETERKLMALFSATNESFVLFDHLGKVKFYNKQLLQLPLHVKSSGNVSIGSTLFDLGLNFPGDLLEESLSQTLEGLSKKQIFELENHSQEPSWWAVNTFPALNNQGSLLGAVLSIEEVTEEILNKLEIIDRHNQLRELAKIHSHEVRKPLANVLGLIDILSNTSQEEIVDQEKLKHLLSGQISELDVLIQQLNQRNF